MEDLKVGSVVKGEVTGVETYGIFVKINDEYNGLVHIRGRICLCKIIWCLCFLYFSRFYDSR